MTLPRVLRALVVAVALLGVIDPAVPGSLRPLLDVDVAVPRPALPAGESAGSGPASLPAADGVAQALTVALDGLARLRARSFGPGERLPCAVDVPCVVVTGSAVPSLDGHVRRQPLFVLPVLEVPAATMVTLDDVALPPAHLDAQATAVVRLSSSTAAGDTRIDVFDGTVPVGTARHVWTAASPVTLAAPWWPTRAGMRRLTVVATTAGPGGIPADRQQIDATVDVSDTPWPVLVVEPRPSWATTFARRALEQDPRLAVDAHVVLAPGLATGLSRSSIDDSRVAGARVVIAGAPERLTEQDVHRLERYLTERGGAVVLVPDAEITGPISRLLPGRWRRHLAATPAAVGTLRAGEWLFGSGLAPGDVVMAEADGMPVIVSRALGEGRLIVVGALDAWRFRSVVAAGADGTVASGQEPYARFWQGLVGDLARGSAPPVQVTVGSAPGDDHATVDVQARTLDPRLMWTASARVICGADVQVMRLWPGARAGQFQGQAPWPPDGETCEVAAAVAGLGDGRAWLTAPPDTPAGRQRVITRLRALAAASDGAVVAAGDVAGVVRALVALRADARVPATWYPMRSWWWGLVAVLGLGAEWWWRRRAGMR